jgi:hypothetical protein
MTRDELILRTRQLIAEGDRLEAQPSLGALQTWLQLSDDLLATAWGTMDRYHLAWLMVGKPKGIVRGRPMTPDEEAAYVREVVSQKRSALQMSLDAVERQRMPFRGETGGVGAGQGMGEVPATGAGQGMGEVPAMGAGQGMGEVPAMGAAGSDAGPDPRPGERAAETDVDDTRPQRPDDTAVRQAQASILSANRAIPLDPELQRQLEERRRLAEEHADHGQRRAPRPERLQR